MNDDYLKSACEWLQRSFGSDLRTLNDLVESNHQSLHPLCEDVGVRMYEKLSNSLSLKTLSEALALIVSPQLHSVLVPALAQIYVANGRCLEDALNPASTKDGGKPPEAPGTEDRNQEQALCDTILANPYRMLYAEIVVVSSKGARFDELLRDATKCLRAEVTGLTLTITAFRVINSYDESQRAAFIRLLVAEAEEEKVIKALEKTNAIVARFDKHYSRLQWVSENYPSLRIAATEQEKLLSIAAERPLADFQESEELHRIEHFAVREDALEALEREKNWVQRLLQHVAPWRVFPLDPSEFLNSLYSHHYDTPSNTELSFLHNLLQVSFPEVLLLLQLCDISPEEKDECMRQWWELHCNGFQDWLLQECEYRMNEGAISIVFTRDCGEILPKINGIEYLYGENLPTEEELNGHLEDFFSSERPRLWILDVRSESDLVRCHSTLPHFYSRVKLTHQYICILVRRQFRSDLITGCWPPPCKVWAFESLSHPFAESFEAAKEWVEFQWLSNSSNWQMFAPRIHAVLTRLYQSLDLSAVRTKVVPRLAESKRLMQILFSKAGLDEQQDWKLRLLEEAGGNGFLKDREIAMFAQVFRPVVVVAEKYNAFPSFLNGGAIVQKIWSKIFDFVLKNTQIINTPSFDPSPPLLHFPFVLRDFNDLLHDSHCTSPESFLYLEQSFTEKSVTRYIEDQCPILQELVDMYVEEIAELELRGLELCCKGVECLKALCAGQRSFWEAVKEFQKWKVQVTLLCSAMTSPAKVEIKKRALAELDTFSRPLSKPALIALLHDFEEELAFCDQQPMKLYWVEGNKVRTFDCIAMEEIQIKLSRDLGVRHPSVVWMEDALFCCGGEVSSFWKHDVSQASWSFSFEEYQVQEFPNMKREREYHGVVRFHSDVYAIGGSNGGS